MLFRDNSIIFDVCSPQTTKFPQENEKVFYQNNSIQVTNVENSYNYCYTPDNSAFDSLFWEHGLFYYKLSYSTRARYEATKLIDDSNGSVTGTPDLEYAVPAYDVIDLDANVHGKKLSIGTVQTGSDHYQGDDEFRDHFFDLGWNLGFEGDANDTFKLNIHRFGLIGLENKIEDEGIYGQTSINETPLMYEGFSTEASEATSLGTRSCFVGLLAQCDQPYVLYGGRLIGVNFQTKLNSLSGDQYNYSNDALFCHEEGITEDVSNGFIMSICSGERYWNQVGHPRWRSATGSIKGSPKVMFDMTTYQKTETYNMKTASSCIPFMSGIYQ